MLYNQNETNGEEKRNNGKAGYDHPSGELTDNIIEMLQGIESVDANAKQCSLAYLDTMDPPRTVQPEEGIFLEFAPMHRNPEHKLTDPDGEKVVQTFGDLPSGQCADFGVLVGRIPLCKVQAQQRVREVGTTMMLSNTSNNAAGSGIGMAGSTMGRSAVYSENIRMANTIVAVLPILVVYPFLQKYFTSGMMIGALKG